MIRKNMTNKIAIPWYKRNVKIDIGSDTEIESTSINIPKLPKPRSVPREPKPQRQPETDPVRSPAKVPSKVPSFVPNPNLEPSPNPLDKLFPDTNPFGKDFPLPIPIPPIPKDKMNPNPNPQPTTIDKKNPFTESLETALRPIIYFFLAKEIINQIIEVNITDPIYNQMLHDPVLGMVLREAEKSNLDMQAAATYFANYDYSNFNAEQMTKELTALFGAAAAARLIIFFIGRKVVFKI